jgi:hypothetical protein
MYIYIYVFQERKTSFTYQFSGCFLKRISEIIRGKHQAKRRRIKTDIRVIYVFGAVRYRELCECDSDEY